MHLGVREGVREGVKEGVRVGEGVGAMPRDAVRVPDDRAFSSFRAECGCEDGWALTYSKRDISVCVRDTAQRSAHSIKCRMLCQGVSADLLYDVLHDTEYRRTWDPNIIETFDIGKLTVNADVGYYAWKCPKPLRNRDVVTLRSWLTIGNDYMIMNYSVKHPKYPPRKDMVRAVSIQTGYLVTANGVNSCILTYLAQVDPKGSLPKWVVSKSSEFLAPKTMKRMYKACLAYAEWKQRHSPDHKPWRYPEQSSMPLLPLSDLSIQHAASLEHIDESGLAEGRGDSEEEHN
uniref:START domain-containing protein 10 n=1 Tax=Callorhinchus milii TaxID=7868 RepID=V9L5V9_CALMI